MGVSERHAWRLLRAYRKEGVAGVAHGNRGRRPSTTTCPEIQEKVMELATGAYSGFNHSHLTEMLADREGIHLSRSTVRRILLAGGIGSPRRRRAPKRYLRRERYPQEGMLLQIDGSRHNWLDGRGPHLTLIGAVDDATGTVPFALFRQQEDAHGYMLMLREIIDRHGIPTALYSDRHSIFQNSTREPESLEEQLRGRRDPTQFARALEELGIRLILAHTPQAKGREWSGRGTPSRTAWSLRCASPAQLPLSKPTGCSGTSCHDTIGGSASRRLSLVRPIANRPRASPLMRSCASSTCAPWPTTIPSTLTAPHSRCCQMASGPAMPEPGSKSKFDWTAASWSSIRAGAWLRPLRPLNRSPSGRKRVHATTGCCWQTHQASQTTATTIL